MSGWRNDGRPGEGGLVGRDPGPDSADLAPVLWEPEPGDTLAPGDEAPLWSRYGGPDRAAARQPEAQPEPVTLTSRPDIRVALRPLARILRARTEGANPDRIEQQNLRARIEAGADASRSRAEWRLLILAAAFFAGYGLIAARMGLLAATPSPEVMARQTEQIQSARADILDRTGRILATNMVTNSLYAEMRYMVDPTRAVTRLGQIFPDLNTERLSRVLHDPDRSFEWIRPRLSPEQVQAVHEIGEPGLLFGPRDMRLYPNGRLAAHVLGGANFGEQGVRAAEINGVAGVEMRLNERLRDPDLVDVPVNLSIDLTVQAVTAEVLQTGMDQLGARAGAAVIMDVESGEILAMVSLPDFDPNTRPLPPVSGSPTDSPLFNHAVQGLYEMGSVMKSFAVAQALELGLVTTETMLDTRSPMRVGRHSITDYRYYGPRMSLADVYRRSSNIGTARLVQMIGAQNQREFLRNFGFLAPSQVEVIETSRARPGLPERWTDASAITISYGHGMTTSPVHLAAAYAALVNGGTSVTPTLLRNPNPEPGVRLISEATSATMRRLMRLVVTDGSARLNGQVEGYALGGKTGTADKPMPTGGYYRDRVIASFAGAFPMTNPRYSIVVMLDEPEDNAAAEARRTAGWTVVPVTAEIVRRTAPLLGLRPQSEAEIAAAMALQ